MRLIIAIAKSHIDLLNFSFILHTKDVFYVFSICDEKNLGTRYKLICETFPARFNMGNSLISLVQYTEYNISHYKLITY